MRLANFTSILFLLASVGCGDDGVSPPPGVDSGGSDAGVPPGMDSSTPGTDAGRPRDGGTVVGMDSSTDGGSADGGSRGDAGGPYANCFSDVFSDTGEISLDYDQFGPTVGSHCLGTNHQNITGVQRVVFLGDSVTVGTPPTLAGDFYRSQLADRLASHFGISPPNGLWKQADVLSGRALLMESGDFASCSEWGARTDDLMPAGGGQIADCFPAGDRDKTTLVIMTMGGNDIAAITKDGTEGVTVPDLWVDTMDFVQLLEDAVIWLKDPVNFPNGMYVVFGNMFEFTDGTGDTAACPAASLAGFTDEWDDPTALAEMVIWANEQYARIAVDTGSDMIFMLEEFCGHGFNHDDPSAPCYRGPGTEQWFDLTCIHPNPTGHDQLTDMFFAVVDE